MPFEVYIVMYLTLPNYYLTSFLYIEFGATAHNPLNRFVFSTHFQYPLTTRLLPLIPANTVYYRIICYYAKMNISTYVI